VYQFAVWLANEAVEQLTAYKLGYLVGQLLYEAVEDAVISAAWSAMTAGTAGAAAPTAAPVVAARVQNLSRRMALAASRLGIDQKFARMIVDKVQGAIWWTLKHVEMCFVAGTPVHTAKGLIAIEKIQTGDFVYSRPEDQPDSLPRLQRVIRTVVTSPTRLYHITYHTPDRHEEILSGTGEHPFYVLRRGFIAAKNLAEGDEFLSADGSSAWVTSIRIEDAAPGEHFTTYNFEVDHDHTYHVGKLGVWVHNTSRSTCVWLADELRKHGDLADDALRKLIRNRLKDELEKELKEELGKVSQEAAEFFSRELKKHEDDIFRSIRNGTALPLEPYGLGKGHHVGAKSGFTGAKGYDPSSALAIPKALLNKLGIKHSLITGAQASLYRQFAKTGKALTWDIIEQIETEALVKAGLDRARALATVKVALAKLKSTVSGPTRIPWGG
jgi:hypothetical protein